MAVLLSSVLASVRCLQWEMRGGGGASCSKQRCYEPLPAEQLDRWCGR